MARLFTALGLKFVAAWLILLLFSLIGGPTPGKAAWMAVVVAVVGYLADRALPFAMQGVTRWAIDSGLAAGAVYLAQFLWPGPGLGLPASLLAGFAIGSVEIPLHFLLARLFGVHRKNNEWDGIR